VCGAPFSTKEEGGVLPDGELRENRTKEGQGRHQVEKGRERKLSKQEGGMLKLGGVGAKKKREGEASSRCPREGEGSRGRTR